MRRGARIAVMSNEEGPNSFRGLDFEWLRAETDYRWSGWLVQKKVRRPSRRVVVGEYGEWFRWYMRSQRFRAFQILVLVEPETAVSDKEIGGYIDGLLARLSSKVRQIIVVSRRTVTRPTVDQLRTKEAIRALLYGTRLTRRELLERVRCTLVPISDEMLAKVFDGYRWRISKKHPRYRLSDFDEELLQGMVAKAPANYDSEPHPIGQLFVRNRRSELALRIEDDVICARILKDVEKFSWVTVPFEEQRILEWLYEPGETRGLQLEEKRWLPEQMPYDGWSSQPAPSKNQVRRVLDRLAVSRSLAKQVWYREVGRPAFAYALPGKIPFLERRCGQCVFFAATRKRCRLWWLINKKCAFFDQKWKQPGSPVTGFEVHKMRYASKIGPHSSACPRFLDKKRDHIRKHVPQKCEICGEPIRFLNRVSVACRNCGTRYVQSRNRVRVLTAYEHEYSRLYHEITGGNARADLEAWKSEIAQKLSNEERMREEDLDVLAQEPTTAEEEPPRAWPQFDQPLQEKVDRLVQSTDVARQVSVAMAQSALNATRRIATFAKLNMDDLVPLTEKQVRCAALIENADSVRLLPYEALVMKSYWECFGLTLKMNQQWFGPRKRSRFVTEFVKNPAGRARGYSPVDAAINYLHQRRLRQAERINAEVGFAGRSDGFLHRERHNSRRLGLLLDMIDPFKFADREELLLTILGGGLTWRDFVIEMDRRGSSFYYPTSRGQVVLDSVGEGADNLTVTYQSRQMRLSEAFKEFASNVLQALDAGSQSSAAFEPFIFA
jgi:CRISPR/Cas system-associated endonuclease Cas1